MAPSSIFDQAKNEGRIILTEFESKELLKKVGIPVVETKLARNQKEAVLLSQEIGFHCLLREIGDAFERD